MNCSMWRPVAWKRPSSKNVTPVDSGTSTTIDQQGSFDSVPTADGGSILQGRGINSVVFFPGDAGPGD